jgi:hypothetical protein
MTFSREILITGIFYQKYAFSGRTVNIPDKTETEDLVFMFSYFSTRGFKEYLKQDIPFLLQYLDEDDKAEFLKENTDTIGVEYLFYDWNLNH